MKKLTRNLLFFLFGLLLFTKCATTNYNYFQDGKPSGKNQGRAMLGLSVGTYVDYDVTDEEDKSPEINIGPTIKMAPLISIQAQGGATENIDVGFGLGVGVVSTNLRLFSKFCLLNKKHKFGIGLLPAANLSFTPDTLFGFIDLPSVINANFYLSLPISYDISKKLTLIARPIYGFEWSRLSVTDNDTPGDEFHKSYKFSGRGLSFGVNIKLKEPDGFIYPEVSFISYDKGIHYVPFLGISCSLPLLGINFNKPEKQQEINDQ